MGLAMVVAATARKDAVTQEEPAQGIGTETKCKRQCHFSSEGEVVEVVGREVSDDICWRLFAHIILIAL